MRRISVLAMTKSTGGTALYNAMVLGGLDRARFESHTLCLSEEAEDYADRLARQGLSAEPLDMARYRIDPAGDLAVLRRALAAVRERQVDVVLAHGSKAGVIARLIGAARGVPVVYCQASHPFLGRVQGRMAPLYWAVEFAARGLGGHIVTLTDSARRVTLGHRLAAPEQVSVIRTGIDTESFRPWGRRAAAAAELGLDPRRPVVGWLGRLEPQKAPHDLVDALERVAPRHPEAQFVIAGDGRLRDEIARRLAAPSLARQAVLLPWQDEPARVLEAFDVFVLSSRWEGLPLTLLEAMATGAAPVSTAVDGCAEAIEDGVSGRLVPPARPEALADAIGGLLACPDRRRIVSAAARRRVEERFDRRRMIGDWAALLERLAPGRAAAEPLEAA